MSDLARPVEFLLVQDEPVEELFAREDLAAHKVVNRVLAVRDVRSALAYLDGTAPFATPGVPDVVLLDLNLAWPGGEAVLTHLRSHDATAAVPVVLLVDSPAAEAIVRARCLPVQGYAGKPVDFTCLTAVVRSLAGLGFEVRRSGPDVMQPSYIRRAAATSTPKPGTDGMRTSDVEELTVVFPHWLSFEGDDGERRPPVPADGADEIAFEWVDEEIWAARRGADERLVERAARAIATDPMVHGRRLEILVQNGVIILLGELGSVEAREAAARRAWTVEGVADVCNQLTVTETDPGER